MLRPDRLTIKAQEAVRDALEHARNRGNPVVNDSHLLGALIGQEDGIVKPLLKKAGVSVPRLSNSQMGALRWTKWCVPSPPKAMRRCSGRLSAQ